MTPSRWSIALSLSLSALAFGCANGGAEELDEEITVPRRHFGPEADAPKAGEAAPVDATPAPSFPQTYRDYAAYTIPSGEGRTVVQTLLEIDGTRVWVSTCPLEAGTRAPCTPWRPYDLTNVRSVGGEKYSGYGAWVYDKAGTLVVTRTLVDMSGRVAFTNECPAGGGFRASECTPWTRIDLTTLRGMGDESYRTYGGVAIGAPGAQTLVQTALAIHGRTSFERSCPVDPTLGPDLSRCSDWSENPLLALRGSGTEAYAGYGGFVDVDADGQEIVRQSFVSIDGRTSWGRACPVDATTASISWLACSAWQSVDLASVVAR